MVATPMPPESTMSVGSPRTQAAVKVLGIHAQDVQPRDRSTFPEGMPGEIRFEAFETKRRQMMHSVSGMALDRSLDLTKAAGAAAHDGQPSDATNAFLADVMAREAVSIEKMHKRAKEDVQKIVIEEMAAKKEVEIREGKMEEHRKRVVELKRQEKEKLKAQKQEALKKLEKSVEVRARMDRNLEKEAAERFAAIQVKDEKVEAVLREREEGWQLNRDSKQAERVTQYDRIAKFKGKDMKVRENMYSGIVTRIANSEDRLSELQAELAARQSEKSDRTSGVIARAKETIAAAQQEKDDAYLERIKVHDKKKEVRETIAKDVAKEYLANNKKARSTFEKNYERVLKEREVLVVSPRMVKSMSESYTTNPAWCTENSMKAFETHKTMGELRQLNLGTLRRAHTHQQNQALNKIIDMRHRVKALADSKSQAQDRRYDTLKNVAIEKHHLTFQVERVRDAPPEKMNDLLIHMGLPPIKTGKEEGEEDADKK